VGRGLLGAEPAVQVPARGEKENVEDQGSDPESLSSGDGTKTSLEVERGGEMVGQKIGRYKLLERVGEGGCGVVYVAEQTEPVRRRVALKVIKLGMDTKQVVARFEAERQALAMMDHPNIAKVLDAGATDNGRPYFIMELVRGIKITEYCDQILRPEQSVHQRTARPVHPGLSGHPARASEGDHPPRHQTIEHPRDAQRRRASAQGN
jgi:hypothetical protein